MPSFTASADQKLLRTYEVMTEIVEVTYYEDAITNTNVSYRMELSNLTYNENHST